MKQKISILLLMISFSLFSYSQSIGDYIDVVYLKNGSKIKGIIIEQVPSKTVRIKTKDGSEFVYQVTEIEKFTREEVLTVSNQENIKETDDLKYMDNYKMKQKGYFVNIDALFNSAGSGLRLTNGYRFGRFGNIGLAIGLESINTNNYNTYPSYSSYYYEGNNSVPAISLNLVYSGELLNKRITPFYQVEAGYGFAIDRYGYGGRGPFGYSEEDISLYGFDERLNYGGPMAGLALGVKFHTKKKIFYRLALDAKINSNFSDVTGYYPADPLSSYIQSYNYKDFTAMPGIGIRFGIGF